MMSGQSVGAQRPPTTLANRQHGPYVTRALPHPSSLLLPASRMLMTRSTLYAAMLPLALFVGKLAAPTVSENIAANDNRHSAGTLKNGVLTVAIEARSGAWRPEDSGGRVLDVAAFAEPGKPLSTPGPLIRVPVGTEVRATIRNRLDKPLIVYGFGKTRGLSDSIIVPVNGS